MSIPCEEAVPLSSRDTPGRRAQQIIARKSKQPGGLPLSRGSVSWGGWAEPRRRGTDTVAAAEAAAVRNDRLGGGQSAGAARSGGTRAGRRTAGWHSLRARRSGRGGKDRWNASNYTPDPDPTRRNPRSAPGAVAWAASGSAPRREVVPGVWTSGAPRRSVYWKRAWASWRQPPRLPGNWPRPRPSRSRKQEVGVRFRRVRGGSYCERRRDGPVVEGGWQRANREGRRGRCLRRGC